QHRPVRLNDDQHHIDAPRSVEKVVVHRVRRHRTYDAAELAPRNRFLGLFQVFDVPRLDLYGDELVPVFEQQVDLAVVNGVIALEQPRALVEQVLLSQPFALAADGLALKLHASAGMVSSACSICAICAVSSACVVSSNWAMRSSSVVGCRMKLRTGAYAVRW